jgi:Fic family protein
MQRSREPLSETEIAVIDPSYQPFPAFSEWPDVIPHPEAWEKRQQELKDAATSGPPDQLDRARETAVRAAAFDTGAIEGLYATDRGLTRTIAEQAAEWEQTLRDQEADAAPFFEAQLKTYELVLDAATRSMPANEAWISSFGILGGR